MRILSPGRHRMNTSLKYILLFFLNFFIAGVSDAAVYRAPEALFQSIQHLGVFKQSGSWFA
jgi:hypothetical protein